MAGKDNVSSRKRSGGWTSRAYAGGVDLDEGARDDIDTQHDDAEMTWTSTTGPYPAGEGDNTEDTITTKLFGEPQRIEASASVSTFDRIQQRLAGPDRVNVLKQKFPNDASLIATLAATDPTAPRYAYLDWMLRQTRAGANASSLGQLLTRFEAAKSKLQQKDINKYDFSALASALDEFDTKATEAETEKRSRAKIIYKKDGWTATEIFDYPTMCALGEERWCVGYTHTQSFWDRYMKDTGGRLIKFDGPSKASPYLAYVKAGQLAELKDNDNEDVSSDDPVYNILFDAGIDFDPPEHHSEDDEDIENEEVADIDWAAVQEALLEEFNAETVIGDHLFVWRDGINGPKDFVDAGNMSRSWAEAVRHYVDWAEGEDRTDHARWSDRSDPTAVASDILEMDFNAGQIRRVDEVQHWIADGAQIKQALVWYARAHASDARGSRDKADHDLSLLDKRQWGMLAEYEMTHDYESRRMDIVDYINKACWPDGDVDEVSPQLSQTASTRVAAGLTTFEKLRIGDHFLRTSGAQKDVLTKISSDSFETSDGRRFKVDNSNAPVMMIGNAKRFADMGNSLIDLTNEPVATDPMSEHPAESYHGDNWDEDKELHLGSTDEGVPDMSDASVSSDEWNYEPDMTTPPMTVFDDIGRANESTSSSSRSPFVKVFHRTFNRHKLRPV